MKAHPCSTEHWKTACWSQQNTWTRESCVYSLLHMYTHLCLLVSHSELCWCLCRGGRRISSELHHPDDYVPLAPACLSLCPAPRVFIPVRQQLDQCGKKYLGRFVPLGEGILTMPAASSASLKFRSEHRISDASIPYTVNEAVLKSSLDNLSYMSNEETF